jgi:predicted DNA-binding transcriptional regulator YafY
MRADRLLSLLMLLQARGRTTAARLAEELEVSVRTIYRDLDALSAAGVPVYAERGPGGGCALLDDYRTTLTGLRPEEVRALFMLSIPTPLSELGVGAELRTALLKLSAALPASRREDELQARARFHLDPAGSSEPAEPAPHLRTLHRAVWENRTLHLTYRLPFETQAQWEVEPYGLVAQASTWHLVCRRAGHMRVLRASRVADARLGEETFARSPRFDLAAFWAGWRAEIEARRGNYEVTVRVAPQLLPWLPHSFGPQIRAEIARAAAPDPEGWIRLALPFESLEQARDRLLAFGGAIEVLAPRALRASVADYGAQITARYVPRDAGAADRRS